MQGWLYGKGLIKISLPQGQSYTEGKYFKLLTYQLEGKRREDACLF